MCRTDINGAVHAVSDGRQWAVNSEQKKQKRIVPLGSIATRGAVNSEG